jgi:hypothetical protein
MWLRFCRRAICDIFGGEWQAESTRESGADFETKFKCPVREDLLQFIKTFVLYRIFEEIFCVLT